MRAPRPFLAVTVRLMLLACLSATMAVWQDRRVVDRITVGDATSELEHAYAGDDVVSGVAAGRSFRRARGWMRYALSVFDDTEVTVACIFVGSGGVPQTFELVVENQPVTSYTFRSATSAPATVEFHVPVKITKGRTNIIVMLRGTNVVVGFEASSTAW